MVLMSRLRSLFDNFTVLLIVVIAIASFFPVYGEGAVIFEAVTSFAVALLFFMHGAKLSRQAIIAGAMHWRLHVLVFGFTFVLFPAIGWALKPVLEPLLGADLYMGVLYLCVLPGTVQSAIAFTSLARGNVPAAVCSASASSLIGIVVTPLLLSILLHANDTGRSTVDAIVHIAVQLLLPFLAGHLLRPWIGQWIERHRSTLARVDQSSILLVVYTAFSASVIGGLWQVVPPLALISLTLVCCFLLALLLFVTTTISRSLGFSKEDEITAVFCGSKKSMATGVPMAHMLFAGASIGPLLLPLMIFHQIQLMVCAVLAQRYARRDDAADAGAAFAK
jgi:sodium/bile acid cotransporter 7